MLSVLKQFLSNRTQYVMIKSCWGKLINIVLISSATPITWCQECLRAVLLAHSIPPVHHEALLHEALL